jgi:hypothetical protein
MKAATEILKEFVASIESATDDQLIEILHQRIIVDDFFPQNDLSIDPVTGIQRESVTIDEFTKYECNFFCSEISDSLSLLIMLAVNQKQKTFEFIRQHEMLTAGGVTSSLDGGCFIYMMEFPEKFVLHNCNPFGFGRIKIKDGFISYDAFCAAKILDGRYELDFDKAALPKLADNKTGDTVSEKEYGTRTRDESRFTLSILPFSVLN